MSIEFECIVVKYCLNTLMLGVFLGLGSGVATADQPSPASAIQKLDFSPPPVPGFMLHKPDKPLTLEEMKAQADEASGKARAEKENLHQDQTNQK